MSNIYTRKSQKWPGITKICKTRIFPKMASGAVYTLYAKLYAKYQKHLMRQFWRIYKKLIFGPKINKNGQNRQNEKFPKNGVWDRLYTLIPSNFMPNIKKIQWANFEEYTKKIILSNCSAHFCPFWGIYGILSLCKKW